MVNAEVEPGLGSPRCVTVNVLPNGASGTWHLARAAPFYDRPWHFSDLLVRAQKFKRMKFRLRVGGPEFKFRPEDRLS